MDLIISAFMIAGGIGLGLGIMAILGAASRVLLTQFAADLERIGNRR